MDRALQYLSHTLSVPRSLAGWEKTSIQALSIITPQSHQREMRVRTASAHGVVQWLCWGSLLLLVSGAYAFHDDVHDHGSVSTTKEGFLQMPLIPHHIQRRRLQRERALKKEHYEKGRDASNDLLHDMKKNHRAVDEERPRQYQRRRTANANQVAELFQGYGTHYVDLWIGTPPQRQTVIVDTGSGVTAFPCSGCRDCGVPKYHSDGLFEQEKSDSFKKLNCNECLRGHCGGQECKISMSYQEGSSWNAFEAEDQCYAGGLHSTSVALDDQTKADDLNPFLAPKYAFPLKFGCQTKITGLFVTQVNYYIGFTRKELFDSVQTSFWPQTSHMRDS